MKKFCIIFLTAGFLLGSLFGATAEKISRDKILNTAEEWKTSYVEYRVDESLIDTLKTKIDEDLKIIVYLGLWCSDSVNNVPKFIKILDALKGKMPPVVYWAVGRKQKGEKFFNEEFKVTNVPTFIFLQKNREIGRIVENPQDDLQKDFLKILE